MRKSIDDKYKKDESLEVLRKLSALYAHDESVVLLAEHIDNEFTRQLLLPNLNVADVLCMAEVIYGVHLPDEDIELDLLRALTWKKATPDEYARLALYFKTDLLKRAILKHLDAQGIIAWHAERVAFDAAFPEYEEMRMAKYLVDSKPDSTQALSFMRAAQYSAAASIVAEKLSYEMINDLLDDRDNFVLTKSLLTTLWLRLNQLDALPEDYVRLAEAIHDEELKDVYMAILAVVDDEMLQQINDAIYEVDEAEMEAWKADCIDLELYNRYSELGN